MQIQNLIVKTLPIFEVSETLNKPLAFFEETTYSHVAVVENGDFIGLLSENDHDCFDAKKNIESFRYEMESFFVTADTSWLDVLEKFARNEANLLPVLDKVNKIVGYYDLNDIVSVFINTPFFTEPGGIVVVSKGIKDYSFSEIAQIVESNNNKILGAFITESFNDIVQVTIKINTANLNEVIQTFRRYNYTILFGNNDDQFMEDLKERSDYLNKYLNV